MGLAAQVAAASQSDPVISDLLATRTRERMARKIATVMLSKTFEPRVFDERYSHQPNLRRRDLFFWHGCGFGGVARFSAAPRTTRLPVEPLLVIGESYLQCQMITAMLFEPTVSVEFYPPGYFGEYEYEGLLASDRFEFIDETTLEKLFKLLVEVVKVPGNEEMIEEFFDDEGDPELNLADYRKSTGFFPEFMFEFVGEKPFRVEINLTRGRLLMQAGDKWDGYEVDGRSAWALRTLLIAQREGR